MDSGKDKTSPGCVRRIGDAGAQGTGETHRELESIKAKALEVLANYEKTKAAIRKEVRKEYASTIRHLENERAGREGVVKDKMIEIDRLEARVQSLNNEVFGLLSRSKLWEHECARISDVYHRTVLHYSNPGLIEVQLQVISEYTDALIRFVGTHKWNRDTVDMARKYCSSIQEKLYTLVREIETHPEEEISLASARKNVDTVPGNGDRKT